jgi:hypothetical protein
MNDFLRDSPSMNLLLIIVILPEEEFNVIRLLYYGVQVVLKKMAQLQVNIKFPSNGCGKMVHRSQQYFSTVQQNTSMNNQISKLTGSEINSISVLTSNYYFGFIPG